MQRAELQSLILRDLVAELEKQIRCIAIGNATLCTDWICGDAVAVCIETSATA